VASRGSASALGWPWVHFLFLTANERIYRLCTFCGSSVLRVVVGNVPWESRAGGRGFPTLVFSDIGRRLLFPSDFSRL
jgi:hypothetical protein